MTVDCLNTQVRTLLYCDNWVSVCDITAAEEEDDDDEDDDDDDDDDDGLLHTYNNIERHVKDVKWITNSESVQSHLSSI